MNKRQAMALVLDAASAWLYWSDSDLLTTTSDGETFSNADMERVGEARKVLRDQLLARSIRLSRPKLTNKNHVAARNPRGLCVETFGGPKRSESTPRGSQSTS